MADSGAECSEIRFHNSTNDSAPARWLAPNVIALADAQKILQIVVQLVSWSDFFSSAATSHHHHCRVRDGQTAVCRARQQVGIS